MDYYKMIASENTDSMYEKWSEYRNELTDYIIEGIEHLHIRRKLADTGKRRIYGEYNIETIVAEKVNRPTLAIWGAGGCNDIDIVRLFIRFFYTFPAPWHCEGFILDPADIIYIIFSHYAYIHYKVLFSFKLLIF